MEITKILVAVGAVSLSISTATATLAQTAAARRSVYVCDTSDASKRAWEREYGPQRFVTADEVRTPSAEAWDTPRCMTSREHRRLMAYRTAQAAKTVQIAALR